MSITVFRRTRPRTAARATAAPALRRPCPTCSAASGSPCRHVSTGKTLTGGVHPLRIAA